VRRVVSSSSMQPRAPMRRPSWLSFPACDPPSPICATASRRQCTGRILCRRSTRSIGPADHDIVLAQRKVLGAEESRVIWQMSRAGQGGRRVCCRRSPGLRHVTMGRRQVSVAPLRRARLLGGARAGREPKKSSWFVG
jgi:hypothetical protein